MMRSFTVTLLLSCLLCLSAVAQFNKGQRMIGASLFSGSFNSAETDYTFPSPTTGYHSSTNSAGFNLAPNIGWFVSDQLVVGGRILGGYRYDKSLDDDYTVTFRKRVVKDFTMGLGVFARNYFGGAGGFMPFGQVNLDAGVGNSHLEGFNYIEDYKETYTGRSSGDFRFSGGVSAGVTKMINAHVGLDLFVGYTYTHSKNTFKTTTLRDVGNDGTLDETIIAEPTSKTSNHGVMLGLGFQIFLDKK